MKEKTMELKMKCIEKEVLCETYTPQVDGIIPGKSKYRIAKYFLFI